MWLAVVNASGAAAVNGTAPTSAGTLTLALPTSPSVLPPGWYMLVLVTDSGVPSTTRFVQVVPGAPAQGVARRWRRGG